MGAEARTDIIKGASIKDAFSNAVSIAGQESGYSYSGTISQASGYITERARSRHSALRRGDTALNDGTVSKWGPCVIIPITPLQNLRTFTITIDVTGKDYEDRKVAVDAAVNAKLRQGEHIESVRTRDASDYGDEPKGERKTKVVATPGKGEPVKEYVLYLDGRESTAFPTLTAAKEASKRFLEKDRYTKKVTIIERRRKSEGPLYTYEKVTVKETLVVTATVGKASNEQPTEFVAAGIYSC